MGILDWLYDFLLGLLPKTYLEQPSWFDEPDHSFDEEDK